MRKSRRNHHTMSKNQCDPKIQQYVHQFAPRDISELPDDPCCATLFIPFSCNNPFHSAWDDGCRQLSLLQSASRMLTFISRHTHVAITDKHCEYIWKVFQSSRSKMLVTVQNCHRVFLSCVILALKWMEDDVEDSLHELVRALPWELRYRVVHVRMVQAMESFLYFRVLDCRFP